MHSRRPLLMKTARLTSMRYVFATFAPPRRASCMNSKEFEYCFHFVSSSIKLRKFFRRNCAERENSSTSGRGWKDDPLIMLAPTKLFEHLLGILIFWLNLESVWIYFITPFYYFYRALYKNKKKFILAIWSKLVRGF